MEANQIYRLKGVAIVLVVYAHCANRFTTGMLDEIVTIISANIATVGVPIFFFLSGYLFHRRRLSEFVFRIINIFISWFLQGH